MPHENYKKFKFVSINKGVLGHSHAHSFTYHLCLLLCCNGRVE